MPRLRAARARLLTCVAGVVFRAVFRAICRAGFRPSLNLLYALEGAILDCHWQDIPDARREELVSEAEREVALLPQPKGRRMPAAGPVTTTQSSSDEMRAPAPDENFGFDDPAATAD